MGKHIRYTEEFNLNSKNYKKHAKGTQIANVPDIFCNKPIEGSNPFVSARTFWRNPTFL